MKTYALIGHPLTHSFSQGYFTEKFDKLGLTATHQYVNFDLPRLDQLKKRLDEYNVRGCNVTIPYKQAIIPYLDGLDRHAEQIGAVNTIAFRRGRMVGFNTDYIGFRHDLTRHLRSRPTASSDLPDRALVLGTGGASLAVRQALTDMGYHITLVSRTPGSGQVTYSQLDPSTVGTHHLIVNTTPLGMWPRVREYPEIPYEALTAAHFCYDLVYNPAETEFMRRATGAGAGAVNGLGMLYEQAEAAWEIWNAE
jgi:shikimate dehydrogenase